MYILLSGWFTQNWRVGVGFVTKVPSIAWPASSPESQRVPTRELVLKNTKDNKESSSLSCCQAACGGRSIDFLGQLQTCSATRRKRRRKRHHTPLLSWSVWEFMSLSENSDDDCEVMNTVFNLLLMWRGYENWHVSVLFTACLCTLYSLSLCLSSIFLKFKWTPPKMMDWLLRIGQVKVQSRNVNGYWFLDSKFRPKSNENLNLILFLLNNWFQKNNWVLPRDSIFIKYLNFNSTAIWIITNVAY